MTNRPVCPKALRKPASPCIFCEDGSYCAHQYHCPATRRYENSPGWRQCKKGQPSSEESKAPPAAETVSLPETGSDEKTEGSVNLGTSKVNSRKRRKR